MENHPKPTTVFRAPTAWTERLRNAVKGVLRQILLRRRQEESVFVAHTYHPAKLTIQITALDEQRHVLCLALIGAVNHITSEGMFETVKAHYGQGNRRLILDLRRTTELKLSGLFALVNIARLYNGQPILDPKDGWLVMGQAAEECTPDLARRVKLLAPSRAAEKALGSVRYGEFFERHADLSSALAAFSTDAQRDDMSTTSASSRSHTSLSSKRRPT